MSHLDDVLAASQKRLRSNAAARSVERVDPLDVEGATYDVRRAVDDFIGSTSKTVRLTSLSLRDDDTIVVALRSDPKAAPLSCLVENLERALREIAYHGPTTISYGCDGDVARCVVATSSDEGNLFFFVDATIERAGKC